MPRASRRGPRPIRPAPTELAPTERPRPNAPRDAVFQPEFREDLRFWIETDRRVALRAIDLIEAIVRDPFEGLGKTEPLKYLAPDTWSRRLTEADRIVYLVSADRIDFLQARYHY